MGVLVTDVVTISIVGETKTRPLHQYAASLGGVVLVEVQGNQYKYTTVSLSLCVCLAACCCCCCCDHVFVFVFVSLDHLATNTINTTTMTDRASSGIPMDANKPNSHAMNNMNDDNNHNNNIHDTHNNPRDNEGLSSPRRKTSGRRNHRSSHHHHSSSRQRERVPIQYIEIERPEARDDENDNDDDDEEELNLLASLIDRRQWTQVEAHLVTQRGKTEATMQMPSLDFPLHLLCKHGTDLQVNKFGPIKNMSLRHGGGSDPSESLSDSGSFSSASPSKENDDSSDDNDDDARDDHQENDRDERDSGDSKHKDGTAGTKKDKSSFPPLQLLKLLIGVHEDAVRSIGAGGALPLHR